VKKIVPAAEPEKPEKKQKTHGVRMSLVRLRQKDRQKQ